MNQAKFNVWLLEQLSDLEIQLKTLSKRLTGTQAQAEDCRQKVIIIKSAVHNRVKDKEVDR